MANTAIVIYHPQREQPARKGIRFFGRVKMLPGRNTITMDKLEEVRRSPLFSEYYESGILVIVEESPTETIKVKCSPPAVDVNDLSIVKGLPIIKTEENLDVLNLWLTIEQEQKQRDKIIKAISRRIKSLKEEEG